MFLKGQKNGYMPEDFLKTWLEHLNLFYQVAAVQAEEHQSSKDYQVVYLDF